MIENIVIAFYTILIVVGLFLLFDVWGLIAALIGFVIYGVYHRIKHGFWPT